MFGRIHAAKFNKRSFKTTRSQLRGVEVFIILMIIVPLSLNPPFLIWLSLGFIFKIIYLKNILAGYTLLPLKPQIGPL